jgi:hypothetical protein
MHIHVRNNKLMTQAKCLTSGERSSANPHGRAPLSDSYLKELVATFPQNLALHTLSIDGTLATLKLAVFCKRSDIALGSGALVYGRIGV